MNSYWNREADSEFTLDLLCFSQIDFRFNICFKNLLFFAMSWLGILNHFGNWLWIHFSIKHFYGKFILLNRFFHREFAIIPLSAPRFHYYVPIWIHYLNSWYVLRIDFESGIVFENSLWIHSFSQILLYIHYLFFQFTLNLLSFSRIYYDFAFFFANSPLIRYLIGEFTLNT